jgi:hypothetical protein
MTEVKSGLRFYTVLRLFAWCLLVGALIGSFLGTIILIVRWALGDFSAS